MHYVVHLHVQVYYIRNIDANYDYALIKCCYMLSYKMSEIYHNCSHYIESNS